jgi:small conductance mechanosensitive channel
MNPDKIAEAVGQLAAQWGLRVIGVLLAVVLSFMVAGWTRRAMLRSFEKAGFDSTLGRFFSNVVRYAILVAAVLGCLGVFGIQTTSFAAVIAAGGLAIGLAFQGTLSNFAAGVMLLVFRPFKVGDVIVVAGTVGVVQEIELFTCELTTLDNRRVIIPNSAIFGSKIENITHHPTRRVDIGVGTAYSADIDQVRGVLEAALGKVEGVMGDPAPQVFLKGFGASSIDWQLRGWCKTEDYWDVWQRIIRDTKVALDGAGIGIPFPQQDVHLDAEAIAALQRKG